jgi:6-phosphogluconolactonase
MILYAGSFTEMIDGILGGHGNGISCFRFDPSNGTLQFLHHHLTINPSYLCIPSTKYLYTHTEVLEVNKPRVQVFKINEYDFSLLLLNELEIPGGCPCHINFSKKYNCILVACYETGNIIIYPVGQDGKLLPPRSILQHEGSSVNKLRQERAHAHAVAVDDNMNKILVTDLGIDKIMVYQMEIKNGKVETKLKQAVPMLPGSGPRHIIVHAQTKLVYTLNELSSTITLMDYRDGDLKPLQTYQTLPDDFKEIPNAAAIRVSEDGKFIYVSERADDCISIVKFDYDNDTVEIIGRINTMGKTPRDVILDPTGNWLLIANQDSDSIAIFKVDKAKGMIIPANLVEGIGSPVCLEWLPAK